MLVLTDRGLKSWQSALSWPMQFMPIACKASRHPRSVVSSCYAKRTWMTTAPTTFIVVCAALKLFQRYVLSNSLSCPAAARPPKDAFKRAGGWSQDAEMTLRFVWLVRSFPYSSLAVALKKVVSAT